VVTESVVVLQVLKSDLQKEEDKGRKQMDGGKKINMVR